MPDANFDTAIIIEPGDKWFIWTKRGRPPRFAHDTEESAMDEAKRLALLNPEQKFHVMRSLAKVYTVPVPDDGDSEARKEEPAAS